MNKIQEQSDMLPELLAFCRSEQIMNIKLSKTSKMPGLSWSLQAVETCPGARDNSRPSGLVPACDMCYARGGNYHRANVKNARAENLKAWKHRDFVPAMVELLQKEKFFRWFDSGDCYHIALARKIKEIAERTPWCAHWWPGRMWKFPKFRTLMDEMNQLDNMVVRFSSDSITGEYDPAHEYGSTIVRTADKAPKKAFVCRAYTREGKCGDCRACWSKDVHLVAYPSHGQLANSAYKKFDLVMSA